MNERMPSFLQKYEHFEKQYLTADFSPRKYFRWHHEKTSLILMDSPDLDSLNAFVSVDRYLRSIGLNAPEIYEIDQQNGYLLLEDFGDATFTRVLQESPRREHEIYQSAVCVLTYLLERTSEQLPFLKDYTVDFGVSKIEQFLNHYYPEIMETEIGSEARDNFIKAWKTPLAQALQAKKTIFLRDYHVDNLMDLPLRDSPKNVGLLDFQDAMWAPIALDFVSLIEDARRSLDDELTNQMWKKFLDSHPKGDHEEIYISGLVLSAVRHIRIIGLFTRVARQKGDKRFLSRIPHLWTLFERCCKISELSPVKEWFDLNVPKAKRVIPAI